ncbi:transmembrane and coiled-coil domain-containing protein 3 isoform X10 [Bubalus bubalis]|uniref:transmembrane and coiled-coil domain-containing protein 3 isoform X10 n=1 Tax=Bubalus bubalis TaxID=89462 RepID=UPI001E1B7F03|nr:transmembrane and coiled-coil domain-containing protein 3 isoform X10 [Bubalus bubalis]
MKVPGRSRFWMWLPFLQLLASGAEQEGVAGPAVELPRGRGAAVPQRRPWVLDGCRRLSGLLRQKAVVLNKLEDAIRAVERDASLSDQEKLFRVHTLEIFQKELNESENSVFQAVHGLQRALQGDYRDVANMKESSRQRLEALREAAIKEETEYVELLAAEKHQVEALKNMQHRNKSLSMLDEILEDVRRAADRLELEIEEHAFDDNKSVKGVNFEAVLRVEEEEADPQQNLSRREVEEDLGLSMLIDSQNNQYILTRPRDATIPRADHHLIKDLVSIVMLSLPCGWLCTTIGLPTMFGYIICGVLLGPSGLNSIKSIVQVETLGEFGVFFTLFLVGLEFSPEKLRKRRHGGPAAPGPGRAGPLLARRRSARLSAGEDLSRRPLLPEAARGEQREQGDPGPGRLRLHLPHADGHRAAGCVHGAGLLPGWSPGVLPGPRGRRGGRVLCGARPRLSGHCVLRVHRPSRVPHLRALRAHCPAGPHALGGGHEVCLGSPGPVPAPAQDKPVHQVDRGRWAGPGQRVRTGPGEPGTQSPSHLPRDGAMASDPWARGHRGSGLPEEPGPAAPLLALHLVRVPPPPACVLFALASPAPTAEPGARKTA